MSKSVCCSCGYRTDSYTHEWECLGGEGGWKARVVELKGLLETSIADCKKAQQRCEIALDAGEKWKARAEKAERGLAEAREVHRFLDERIKLEKQIGNLKESETLARVVAWLRAKADETPMCVSYCTQDTLHDTASAIERGEWREEKKG